MRVTKIEVGTVVVLVLAVIAGAVQFGRLEERVAKFDQLDPSVIEKALARAVERINSTAAEHADLPPLVSSYLQRQWCDVEGFRHPGTKYWNREPVPIELAISTKQRGRGNQNNRCNLQVYVNGQSILQMTNNNDNAAKVCGATATVPGGASYEIAARGHQTEVEVLSWRELRTSCPDI